MSMLVVSLLSTRELIMRIIKLLSSVFLLAGIFVSGTALADRGHGGHRHVGIGLYFGEPYYPYYPPYYYPYQYYYPPVMAAPAQPPVYIEQQDQAPSQISPAIPQQATPDSYYWYHCDKPEGYYPYIKNCPDGWQKVAPTPPPQP